MSRSSSPVSSGKHKKAGEGACGAPAGLQALPADAVGATVSGVPVSSWSTGGTIAVSYREELGLGPQAAIVDPTWVTSPCVQKLVGCGVTASWDQAGG